MNYPRPRTTHRNTKAQTRSRTRDALVGLLLFNALSALGGGIGLAGAAPGVPAGLLRHTPFDSFVAPGIFLGTVIGGSALIGAAALLAHASRSLFVSAAAGATMIGWTVADTLLIEGFSWVQGLFLLTGLMVVIASIRLSQEAPQGHDPQRVAVTREYKEALG